MNKNKLSFIIWTLVHYDIYLEFRLQYLFVLCASLYKCPWFKLVLMCLVVAFLSFINFSTDN